MATRTVPVPLPVTTSPGRDGFIGGARLINCMAVTRQTHGSKPQTQVWATAGLKDFVTLAGASDIRGVLEVDGVGYVVAGPLLYTVTPSGTPTLIGAVSGTGAVKMDRNRRQPSPDIVIVSDGLVYICNGTTLTHSVDTDLPPPNGVVVIDGYAVYTIADGRILASAIDEAGNIDPLSVAREDTNPDGNVGISKRGKDVVIFGTRSVGFWHDVGDTPFPLTPIAAIDGVGCMSGASIVTADQTLFWVANDGTVRRLNGYAADIVSSDDVAEAIASSSDRANIQAFSWVDRGNTLIEFSCVDWTYVLNTKTGRWHEQKSYGAQRWRAAWYMNLGGRHIVGDYAAGKLYEIDPATYTDAGEPLVMEMHTGTDPFSGGMTIDSIWAEAVTGVGLTSTPDHLADPEMMIAVSKDYGRTWPIERRARLGKIGEYTTRVYAHLFGSNTGAMRIRLSISAAVARGILSLVIDAEGLHE